MEFPICIKQSNHMCCNYTYNYIRVVYEVSNATKTMIMTIAKQLQLPLIQQNNDEI
jgi:hypothetical protein